MLLCSPDGTDISRKHFKGILHSMKANFNFKSWVGNPTTARYSTVQYKGKMLILNILNAKPFFLGHSQSENQTCFENGMARALKGRVYKFENVMGS